MKRLFLLFPLYIAACGPQNVIRLNVVGDSTVDDALRARVTALNISVTGVQNRSKPYPVSGLPSEERIELLPSVTSGDITIEVDATDARPTTLATGMTTATVTGGVVTATITLTAKAPGSLSIDPPLARVTRTKTLPFKASGAVTWTVVDANGGAIDADGVYTAPDAPGGPYTIKANSTTDDGVATAQVTVADYGLELVAGVLGGPGFADGAGTDARMMNITASAVDDTNHVVYLADGTTIRKADFRANPATIETVVGSTFVNSSDDGTFDQAHFTTLEDMAIDPTQSFLYVCDGGSFRIVDLVGKTVSGNWQLNGCTSLALDPGDGTSTNPPALYLGYASSIKKVAISAFDHTYTPTVDVAGKIGVSGFVDGPNSSTARFGNGTLSMVIDLNAGFPRTLYVADSNEHAIRKVIDSSTASVTTVAGSGVPGHMDGAVAQATFDTPTSLTLKLGVLVVADAGNRLIRHVDLQSGMVSTVLGTYVAPSADGRNIAVNSVDGSPGTLKVGSPLFVADTIGLANGRSTYIADGPVLRIGLSSFLQTEPLGQPSQSGFVDGIGSAFRANFLTGLVGDGSTFYFSDYLNSVIRTIDIQTGKVTTIAGNAGYFDHVDAVGNAGRFRGISTLALQGTTLYVADSVTLRGIDLSSNTVTTLSGLDNSAGTADGDGSSARFQAISSMDSDGTGITIADGCRIRRYDFGTKNVSTVAGQLICTGDVTDGVGTAASLRNPQGVTHEAGSWYFADDNTLRKIEPGTGQVTTVVGLATKRETVDGRGTNAHATSISALIGNGHGVVYFVDGAMMRSFDVSSTEVKQLIGKVYERQVITGTLSQARLNTPTGLSLTSSSDIVMSDLFENSILVLRLP